MAAAGLQSTDVLHYESRAIRAGLKASINRLASAKGYIPSSLTPEELRQHGVPQDWSAPKVIVDFEEVRNGLSRGWHAVAGKVLRPMPRPCGTCAMLCSCHEQGADKEARRAWLGACARE